MGHEDAPGVPIEDTQRASDEDILSHIFPGEIMSTAFVASIATPSPEQVHRVTYRTKLARERLADQHHYRDSRIDDGRHSVGYDEEGYPHT